MVGIENCRKYIQVRFFDGIYEVIRRCYLVPNSPVFVINDTCGEETYTVTKRVNDRILCCFNLDDALSIMEETANLDESDRDWMINQIRLFSKTNLSSIYGKMCQEYD